MTFYRARQGWLIHNLSVYVEKKIQAIFIQAICLSHELSDHSRLTSSTTNQPIDRWINDGTQLPHRNGLNYSWTFDIITTQYFTIEIISIEE